MFYDQPILIICDNTSSISMSKNLVFSLKYKSYSNQVPLLERAGCKSFFQECVCIYKIKGSWYFQKTSPKWPIWEFKSEIGTCSSCLSPLDLPSGGTKATNKHSTYWRCTYQDHMIHMIDGDWWKGENFGVFAIDVKGWYVLLIKQKNNNFNQMGRCFGDQIREIFL